jgi:hypothetical protein
MPKRPSHHAMPADAWEFLADDEEPAAAARSSEEAAMHATPDGPVVVLRDPAAREVDIGYEAGVDDSDDPPVSRWFDDEEPDMPSERTARDDASDVVDLEEILEIQHYAFPADTEPDGEL